MIHCPVDEDSVVMFVDCLVKNLVTIRIVDVVVSSTGEVNYIMEQNMCVY